MTGHSDWFSEQQQTEFDAIHEGFETVLLPGLRCPNCRRLAYDAGGGRACYSKPGAAYPEYCGVMESVTLEATVVQMSEKQPSMEDR